MLPLVVVFFLQTFHVNSRSIFEWRDTSNTIKVVIKSICSNDSLSEYFQIALIISSSTVASCGLRLRIHELSCFNDGKATVLLRFLRFCAGFRVDNLSRTAFFAPLPDKHLGVWLLRLNGLPKLLLTDLLISIEVDSPDNCKVVTFVRFLSLRIEKPF